MKQRIILLISLLGIMPMLFSQGFSYLNVSNGLSSNQVFQVKKDSAGFIWFVTYNGINRFDGSAVKEYKLQEGNFVYENYPSYTQMVVDEQGVVSTATQDGKVFKYNKWMDRFELLLDVRKQLNSFHLLIRSFYYDREGRIWIFSSAGAHIFDKKTDEIKEFSILPVQDPTCVVQNNNGSYVVGSKDCLFIVDTRRNGDFYIQQQITVGDHIGTIQSLRCCQHKIYVATSEKGVFVYDTKRQTVRSLFPAIPYISVRSLNVVDDDRIVIGSDGAGLYIIDRETDLLLTHYDADKNMGDGLTSNEIYDVLVDENNCLWVTTFANGVNIIDPLLMQISVYRHVLNEPNSLINNQVHAVFEDSDGDLWIGTNNGVSCYEARSQRWKHYLTDRKRKIVIISFCQDSRGNIWAGSYGIGVYRINKKSGQMDHFMKDEAKPAASINTNYVYSLYAQGETVWIGGLWGGTTCYNMADNSYRIFDFEILGEVASLDENRLLFGTSIGFCIFDLRSLQCKSYSRFGEKLPTSTVRKFYVAGNNEVWLGTEGNGLVLFNPQTDEFQKFTIEDGLSSNNILSMEGDDLGLIWITTERTLLCFDMTNRKFTDISKLIGLHNTSFVPYASTKRKNNRLAFGTVDGVIEFPAQNFDDTELKTRLIFTDFKLFYNSVGINQHNSPLKKAINETAAIVLRHNQNSFSFDFASINYRSQQQITYACKLEGFDTEWHEILNTKTVAYTNISPGSYLFRLRALNANTKQILDERMMDISVKSPFWLSIWAMFVYIALLLVVLWFVFLYFKNAMEKQRSKEKIRFFTSIAHDIRTPITLIKAPLNDLSDKENLSANGKTALDIAIRNADKIFQMVSQLLDVQKADMSSLRLIISKNELKKYLQEKVVQFRVEAERKNISLIPKIHFEKLNVWFDREKMDKIVNNLLANAIKYTPQGGSIYLEASENEKKWLLTIKDTGIGIPISEQKYIFTRFFRARNAINSKEIGSGIGLLLTKELVSLHEGTISFSSRENIGTEFRLTFHKGKQYFLKKELLKGYIIEEKDEDTIETSHSSSLQTSDEHLNNPKILLVEDNDDMRAYLRAKLSESYQIFEATDGQDALEKTPEINPDLIVSDNFMPNLNGDEMCFKLKNSMGTSHIPVILLTALADKKNIIKGLDCGADDYITKPFDIVILQARIRNMLQNSEKRKQILSLPNEAPEEVQYVNPLDKKFMDKITSIIEEHLDHSEFSINDLCLAMYMSRSTLFNKLKALTGQGPNDFIRIYRLNRAKELLLTKQYNVFETSIMTGFTDTKYFSTAFKKQFGISPSKIGKN
ncbi:MAG: response regulator [Dysgonamonadaceae bacterium]|jgi:signal transduction histidine kinase/DNA-binding response OmpR family regulator/ligand-binding sensor domain-containing protein|nr:response regulator [Dysgonamonadaceae bacterium]